MTTSEQRQPLLPVGLEQDRQHGRAEVDRVVRLGRRRRGGVPCRCRRRRDRRPGVRPTPRRRLAPARGRGLRGPARRLRRRAPRRPAGRPRPTARRARPVGRCPASAPSRCSRQATNWPSSLSETSCITPRPNWAGLPVTARSVTTSTSVPPEADGAIAQRHLGAGGAVAALVLALGVDHEPVRRLVLLHEGARAVVDQRDRPSLTFTEPLNESPSAEVTWAPGKHSATDAMSWKCAQVSSTGVGTVNRWVRSMQAIRLPRRRARPGGSARRRGAAGSRRRR